MLRQIRRIVTTNDADGKSRILIDGMADRTITVMTEMWMTKTGPANHLDMIDHAANSASLAPPAGGTVFRFFQIAPEATSAHLTEEERRKADADWFAQMNASDLQPDTARHSSMHRSRTTDYIILLSGRITLVLDKDERDLEPFDVVIQRGTNHAWVNRGSEDALLMAVLVDDGSST